MAIALKTANGEIDLATRRDQLRSALSRERAANSGSPTGQSIFNISEFENELADVEEALAKQKQADIEKNLLDQSVQGQAESEARSRQSLKDIFNTARTSGESNINRRFADDRGRAIDEASAARLSRMPGFLTKSLADIDARKTDTLADFFGGLETERARGKLGLEDTLFGRGQSQQGLNLQKAGLLTGVNEFGQNLGFNREQFGEQKRRSTIDDIFNQKTLDQAERLGRAQAEASEPGFYDKFGAVTGGIGSLLGGVGSLIPSRPSRKKTK